MRKSLIMSLALTGLEQSIKFANRVAADSGSSPKAVRSARTRLKQGMTIAGRYLPKSRGGTIETEYATLVQPRLDDAELVLVALEEQLDTR